MIVFVSESKNHKSSGQLTTWIWMVAQMQLPEERQREPTLCFHTLSIYLCHLSFIDCLWITRLKLGGACHQCRQAKRPASVPCMKACKRLAVVASQSISTKPDKLNCWHYTRSLNNVEVWWSGKDGTKSWKGVCVVIQYIISYTSSYKLQVTSYSHSYMVRSAEYSSNSNIIY